MIVKDYISKDYPNFTSNTNARSAQLIAKDFAFSHFFIADNGVYQYALPSDFDDTFLNTKIDELPDREFFFVKEDDLILQCISLFSRNHCNVLPVLNDEKHLVGSISSEEVLMELGGYPFLNNEGCFLIIEHDTSEFSAAIISRIIEENNTKMFGFFISDTNSLITQAVIKMSANQVDAIQQSLERYNYRIVKAFFKTNKEAQLKERLDYLQKFLEI